MPVNDSAICSHLALYNVLEKLRSGESLTDNDRAIHDHGLVSVLQQIHDELDAAVSDAYGWPRDLTDEQILERLVALNHARAAEEAKGIIRWLRPDFQNPAGAAAKKQANIELPPDETDDDEPAAGKKAAKAKKLPWPKGLPERVRAVIAALSSTNGPASPSDLAPRFAKAKKDEIAELLETLVAVGQARRTKDGRYVT